MQASQSVPGPVRPIRKQNSSCDTCKSRKVKCDLSDLPPGSNCGNCSYRGIPCTQEKNLTRKSRRETNGPRQEATTSSAQAELPLLPLSHPTSDSCPSQQPSQYYDQGFSQLSASFPPPNSSLIQSNAFASGSSIAFQSSSSYTSYPTAPTTTNQYPIVLNLSSIPQSSLSSLFFDARAQPVLSIPSFTSSQSRLVDSTLSQSLERSLVDHFFLSAHTHLQSVDPLEFKAEYQAAYETSSLLPPAAQCVVALMAAHGARLSDSAHHASFPNTAISERERGGREAMSQALAKRGLDLIESCRLTARPSKRSIEAISLARSLALMTLMSSEDGAYSDDDLTYFGSSLRLFSAAIHDHIYSLGLWDEAERLNSDRAHQSLPPMEVPNQRLLWIAYTSDSFELLSDRPRPSRVTNEQFFSAFPYVPRVDQLPSLAGTSADFCFLLLMGSYPMFGELARKAVDAITIPAANKSSLQPVETLASACESLWRKNDVYVDWVDQVAGRALHSQSPNLSANSGGLSPLLFFIRVRMAGTGLWMQIHSVIRERLTAERRQLDHFPSSSSPDSNSSTSNDSFIFDPFEALSPLSMQPSILILQELELVGLERAMSACRLMAHRVKRIAQCRPDLIGIELAPDFQYYHAAQFLARIPTVEQGLRGKMPSFDYSWTWKTKCEEIDWLLHAMEMMSGPIAVSQRILRVSKLLGETLPPGFAPFRHTPFYLARFAYAHPQSNSRSSWLETEVDKFIKLFTTPSSLSISSDLQIFEPSSTSMPPHHHVFVSHPSTIPPDPDADPLAFLYTDERLLTDPSTLPNSSFDFDISPSVDQVESALFSSQQYPNPTEGILDLPWAPSQQQDSLGVQELAVDSLQLNSRDSAESAELEEGDREGYLNLDMETVFNQYFATAGAVF